MSGRPCVSGTPSRRYPSGPRCCGCAREPGTGSAGTPLHPRAAPGSRDQDSRLRTGGWDTISVPFSDVGWFAEHLASFGTDVVALEPADLREAVITQLKGALA